MIWATVRTSLGTTERDEFLLALCDATSQNTEVTGVFCCERFLIAATPSGEVVLSAVGRGLIARRLRTQRNNVTSVLSTPLPTHVLDVQTNQQHVQHPVISRRIDFRCESVQKKETSTISWQSLFFIGDEAEHCGITGKWIDCAFTLSIPRLVTCKLFLRHYPTSHDVQTFPTSLSDVQNMTNVNTLFQASPTQRSTPE